MRRWILIAGVVLVLGLAVFYWWGRRSPYNFPAGAIVAYKMDGHRLKSSNADVLYSWPILQRQSADPAISERIRAALNDGRNYSATGGYRCFNPGMAFRVGEDGNAVDVLICLGCKRVEFCRASDGQDARALCISDAGLGAFENIYNALFPKSSATNATTKNSP